MKLYRIQAYTARYLYLYKRSLPRLMEVFYWPLVDLFVWGFITVYLSAYKGALPDFVGFFLGSAHTLGHAVSLPAGHNRILPRRRVEQEPP